MPAAPTYGPWFFNHEKGVPVIKRQRFNERGHGGWEYLEGDWSKMLALLGIAARAVRVAAVPSLAQLGADAEAAYASACYHLPGAAVVHPIPRRIDEEQAAIIGDAGKVAITVTYAYDNLVGAGARRNETDPERLWLHNPEARALGMDPWREIIGIDCERPPIERYILEFHRPGAVVRDAASTSLVVSGNHIIYCQAKTARRMGLA